MILCATVLVSLLAGGLLSAFAHFFTLIPAIALILLAHAIKGVMDRDLLVPALSAIAAVTALELGFFLGAILRSLAPPDESADIESHGPGETEAAWSPAGGNDNGSAPRRKRLRVRAAMRTPRDRRGAVRRGRGMGVPRHRPRPAGL